MSRTMHKFLILSDFKCRFEKQTKQSNWNALQSQFNWSDIKVDTEIIAEWEIPEWMPYLLCNKSTTSDCL